MITLWIAAALLAAGAAALIVQRAAAAAGAPSGDPALAVYRRQLGEIDELAERGLLPDDERRAARAEAGRRLLAAADAAEPAPSRKFDPRALLVLAAVGPLAAAGIYLAVGSPGAADLPFAARLKAWRAHPERYAPPELAAALRGVAADRPTDPEPLQRLALLELSLGDLDGAIHDTRKAIALAPDRADLWEALGRMLLMKGKGEITPEAVAAFRRAVALDPRAPNPRYVLARARIAGGDVAGGLADWRALLAELPAADPDRPQLSAQIAAVAATGKLPPLPEPAAAEPPVQVNAAIRGMVEGLAARLRSQPDDPDGWVRLVRAYTVLGESAKRDAALAEARRRYAGDPAVIKRLDGALTAPE